MRLTNAARGSVMVRLRRTGLPHQSLAFLKTPTVLGCGSASYSLLSLAAARLFSTFCRTLLRRRDRQASLIEQNTSVEPPAFAGHPPRLDQKNVMMWLAGLSGDGMMRLSSRPTPPTR